MDKFGKEVWSDFYLHACLNFICAIFLMLEYNFFVAGEMLHVAEAFIDKNYHPTVICQGNVTNIKRLFFLYLYNNLLLMSMLLLISSLQ